jgi:hypothetical protein
MAGLKFFKKAPNAACRGFAPGPEDVFPAAILNAQPMGFCARRNSSVMHGNMGWKCRSVDINRSEWGAVGLRSGGLLLLIHVLHVLVELLAMERLRQEGIAAEVY